MSTGQHPTESPNRARARDDPIEIDRPAEMRFDSIRGRDDQVVVQIVVSRIHQERIIHERQDNDRRREDLTMKDIFVGKFGVSGVQSNLNTSTVSEEWITTEGRSCLIRFGDFNCRNEDVMKPRHSSFHHERLFLSFIRKQLPPP